MATSISLAKAAKRKTVAGCKVPLNNPPSNAPAGMAVRVITLEKLSTRPSK